MPQRPIQARDAVVAPPARRPDALLRARIAFRPATPADVPALVKMINDAYLRESWLLPGPRIDTKQMAEGLQDSRKHVIVAELDGSVRVTFRADGAWFGLLAVAPAQQDRGSPRCSSTVRRHMRGKLDAT